MPGSSLTFISDCTIVVSVKGNNRSGDSWDPREGEREPLLCSVLPSSLLATFSSRLKEGRDPSGSLESVVLSCPPQIQPCSPHRKSLGKLTGRGEAGSLGRTPPPCKAAIRVGCTGESSYRRMTQIGPSVFLLIRKDPTESPGLACTNRGAGDLVAGTAPLGDKSSQALNEGWITGYLVLPSTPPTRSLTATPLPGRTPASSRRTSAQPQEGRCQLLPQPSAPSQCLGGLHVSLSR